MPTFAHWSDEQLSDYVSQAVVPLVGGREARDAEFGPVYGLLLSALLGLLELQERHGLLTCEAQDLVESVFRSYVRKYAPKVEEQAVRYRAEVAKEAAVESARRGEQLQREIERLAAKEKARAEKEAADAEKRHRDARRANAEALAELEKTRERENAAFVESHSR
jgi:hypothetical protein